MHLNNASIFYFYFYSIPAPQLPPLELLPKVALDSFSITIVSYTVTMSMALIFATKEKYEVNGNQELLAMVQYLNMPIYLN